MVKKIAILGANGFIGKNLAQYFSKKGILINAYDYTPYPDDVIKDICNYYSGDFSVAENLNEAIDDCDLIYQLIYVGTPSQSTDNAQADIMGNIMPNLALLDIINQSQKKPRLVFTSSGGTVYGDMKDDLIDENHPTNPISSYGAVKLMIEKYIQIYGCKHELNFNIARISNPYGRYQSIAKGVGLITKCFQCILENKPLEIWGDGEYIRDYIYIDDLVRALALLGLSDDIQRQVFNVGSAQGFSINQVINIVKEVTQEDIQIHYINKRSHDVAKNILDIKKIDNKLKWGIQVPLYKGIKRYWEKTTYCFKNDKR